MAYGASAVTLLHTAEVIASAEGAALPLTMGDAFSGVLAATTVGTALGRVAREKYNDWKVERDIKETQAYFSEELKRVNSMSSAEEKTKKLCELNSTIAKNAKICQKAPSLDESAQEVLHNKPKDSHGDSDGSNRFGGFYSRLQDVISNFHNTYGPQTDRYGDPKDVFVNDGRNTY